MLKTNSWSCILRRYFGECCQVSYRWRWFRRTRSVGRSGKHVSPGMTDRHVLLVTVIVADNQNKFNSKNIPIRRGEDQVMSLYATSHQLFRNIFIKHIPGELANGKYIFCVIVYKVKSCLWCRWVVILKDIYMFIYVMYFWYLICFLNNALLLLPRILYCKKIWFIVL